MIINHPLLGPRDSAEFVYLGDARLIDRPDPESAEAEQIGTTTRICATTLRATSRALVP